MCPFQSRLRALSRTWVERECTRRGLGQGSALQLACTEREITARRRERCARSPCPSCPYLLSPHVYSIPSSETTAQWAEPHATCTTHIPSRSSRREGIARLRQWCTPGAITYHHVRPRATSTCAHVAVCAPAPPAHAHMWSRAHPRPQYMQSASGCRSICCFFSMMSTSGGWTTTPCACNSSMVQGCGGGTVGSFGM